MVAVATLWGCAALWIDGPASRGAAGALAVGFAALSLALPLRLRPRGRGLAATAVVFGALLAWWLSLAPSNDREAKEPQLVRPARSRLSFQGCSEVSE